jgi:glucose/arabinose dehydrogenase
MKLNHAIVLLIMTAVVACTVAPVIDRSAVSPSTTATASIDRAASSIRSSSVAAAPAASRVATQPLTPAPIRIGLANLPQPYATSSASKSPQVSPIPSNPTLKVPAGFEINIFAEGLSRPRWLALTPNGDVLVTETGQDRILMLTDRDGNGTADAQHTFAAAGNGLNQPFGMVFAANSFFLANTDAVLRFPYKTSQSQIGAVGKKIADLPAQGYNNHWTRNLLLSPDGQKLYVSVGSGTNADREPLPRASVQVMNLDGSGQKTFAYGLRNPVGLDLHPVTQELYTTVNERDGLGDDLVPDYLTRIQAGEFYGWPYAYLTPDRLDPRQAQGGRSLNPQLAAQTRTPDVLFQAHSAALGLKFYQGRTFSERYRNGAFVAFRGSWNRNQGTGYKIVFVPFGADNRPLGYYEDFVTGFLTDPTGPTTWGRPVGLLVLSDGSLLFTEEANGRIYRVQYRGT